MPDLPPNGCTIFAFIYATFYILLEPVAGGLIAPFIIGNAILSNHLLATLPWRATASSSTSFVLLQNVFGSFRSPIVDLRTLTLGAIALQVSCWVAQFVGHGKFERRAPALLDNLFQAIFLAPLFVWLEVLFMLGYRPELRARVMRDIECEVKKYRESLKKEQEQLNVTAE